MARVSRRDLLWTGSAALGSAWSSPTWASDPDSDEALISIDLPQLRHGGDWNPRPGAMRELALELRLRTRLLPRRDPAIVTLDDERRLFETPFLYVAGRGEFPDLSASQESALRRFVDLGGMIVFDDADGGTDRAFRRGVEALMQRVVPGSRFSDVDPEHVLYRSFYRIDAAVGRTRSSDAMLGIHAEGRIKVLLMPNDLGGALARSEDGRYAFPCTPGGAVQREWAIRLGVNLLLYATCIDYKSDRAHVETLLQDRRRR